MIHAENKIKKKSQKQENQDQIWEFSVWSCKPELWWDYGQTIKKM